MARIAAQEMAADFLRAQGAAFVKVMGDGHQLARERGDALRLFARGGGLIRTAANSSVWAVQLALRAGLNRTARA